VPRVRLGVVLLIPPPLDREIDALRRAVGDGTYGRVPAHLTLVPPVNVNEDDLGDALRLLREAASATRPFSVHLGPPTTFLPANPVLYLPLVGPGRAMVFTVRERVFKPPLARSLTWPFVPHVTIADEAQPDRITAAEVALCDYGAEVAFDRLHLLQEGPGRVWAPVADAPFEAPAVVGRGGLPLDLTVSQALDPEGRAFVLEHVGADAPLDLAVTARRDRRVVGVAEGWARAGAAYLTNLVVARDVRREGVGAHVLAAFESAAAERGCGRLAADVLAGSEGEGFLRSRGWVEEARRPAWRDGADLVLLRRDR
jgi:2'-5' RNA ligase